MSILKLIALVALASVIPTKLHAADHMDAPALNQHSGVVHVGDNDRVVLGIAGNGFENAESCSLRFFEYDSFGNVTATIDVETPKGFGFVTFETADIATGGHSFRYHLSCSQPIPVPRSRLSNLFIVTITTIDRTSGAKSDYFVANLDTFSGNSGG